MYHNNLTLQQPPPPNKSNRKPNSSNAARPSRRESPLAPLSGRSPVFCGTCGLSLKSDHSTNGLVDSGEGGMNSARLLVIVSRIVIDLFLTVSPVITRLIGLLFPQLHSRLMAMISFNYVKHFLLLFWEVPSTNNPFYYLFGHTTWLHHPVRAALNPRATMITISVSSEYLDQCF